MNGGKLVRSSSVTLIRRNVLADVDRIRQAEGIKLLDELEPVLAICEAKRSFLERNDRKLAKLAAGIAPCRMFMEIPGVGAITALSFYAAIEPETKQSGAIATGRVSVRWVAR